MSPHAAAVETVCGNCGEALGYFASLRRVFGGSRLQAAWKGVLIWIIYFAMVLAVMFAIGLRSLKPSESSRFEREAAVTSATRC